MRKTLHSLILGVLILGIQTGMSSAGELDVLLDKLVDKGVLTPIEATIISDETKQSVASDLTDAKSYAVPSWAQKLKIKQDIRLRYQKEVRDSDVKHRHRGRVRYRLAVISNPFKDIEVGLGLATGSSDPRSTNQTFQDSFSSKGVNLDLAYLQWKPKKGISVVGGKFKRKPYLWEPTDLLWDGDINPEGFSIHGERSLTKSIKGFANAGLWVLDERDQAQGDLSSPYMWYAQVGKTWKKGDFDTKLAATIYKFANVKGNTLDSTASTNTLSNGVLANKFDSKVIGAEVGLKNPLGFDNIERFAIFGHYVKNIRAGRDDQGWASGFKFGHKKVSKPGNWQFKYIYAELQKDAWLDIFPDSDRYGGKTDIKGHEVVLQYALRKNMVLGLDLYKSQRLDQGKNKELLAQLDLALKF